MRIGIGLVFALVAMLSLLSSRQYNPITGQMRYVYLTTEQEVTLGRQAAPEMAGRFGGLDPDPQAQARVNRVGQRLLDDSRAEQSEYPFKFSLLADTETVNAFALPGGPVFVTRALFDRMETEGQLAGVLGHEVVHVLAQHSAEHIAEAQLTGGLTGAIVIASYAPDRPNPAYAGQLGMLVGQMANMKFGRDDELQSDALGMQIMAEAGYDPRSMIRMMEILRDSGGDDGPPEFFSTHPSPENRIGRLQAAIEALYPDGVPGGLRP
ncbi:MAG: M48 family metalloprotease [Chloroflexota bacterium]